MINLYNIEENCLRKINAGQTKVTIMIRSSSVSESEFGISNYSVFDMGLDSEECQSGRNFRKLAKTDWFIYDHLFNEFEKQDYIEKIDTPLICFETGEIIDKPGTFLNFDKPETLDEQLANIYELTEEEQELIKNSIKPWKDKLSLTADGLY